MQFVISSKGQEHVDLIVQVLICFFFNLALSFVSLHSLIIGFVYFCCWLICVFSLNLVLQCHQQNNSLCYLYQVWLKVCDPKCQTCWSLLSRTRLSWQLALLSTESNMVTTPALNVCICSCSLRFKSLESRSHDAIGFDWILSH